MISNLAVFDGGDRAIHTLSKPYPKYDYAETQNKIAHFHESGTKPMTCAKIAECGFKCPKLEHGGCDCKSPATLAFKALSTDELLEILNNLEIKDTQLENIQMLQVFIQEQLYNVEPLIAETLLNYNVKERFSLKASDITALAKLHREVFKRYAENKEQRAEKEQQSELPPRSIPQSNITFMTAACTILRLIWKRKTWYAVNLSNGRQR